jgi:hypothetical protein
MALFEFKLKPLQEVMPWGQEPNLRLNWDDLADGIYYMNVGEEQLFRVTKEILIHWKKKYPNTDVNQPFIDIFGVRFYDDLLENLVDIIQPIPIELQKYIASHKENNYWLKQVWGLFDGSDEIHDTCFLATQWCSNRHLLSTKCLKPLPNITFFRINDIVHIRWDNGDNSDIDGISYWTSARGEYTLSVEAFIQEVESFHQRLMEEMEQRVHIISTNNPFDPRVKIDIPNLIKEHEQRKNSLAEAMRCKPSVEDWSTVINATEKLAMLLKG